jgi:hypothetical protein
MELGMSFIRVCESPLKLNPWVVKVSNISRMCLKWIASSQNVSQVNRFVTECVSSESLRHRLIRWTTLCQSWLKKETSLDIHVTRWSLGTCSCMWMRMCISKKKSGNPCDKVSNRRLVYIYIYTYTHTHIYTLNKETSSSWILRAMRRHIVCVCIYVYIYIYIYIHTYIHIYIYFSCSFSCAWYYVGCCLYNVETFTHCFVSHIIHVNNTIYMYAMHVCWYFARLRMCTCN